MNGLDATKLAARLKGVDSWNNTNYVLDNGLKQAEATGLKVLAPAPNQLFLDIDSREAYDRYQSMSHMLYPFFVIKDISDNPSKSGVRFRRHITITLGHDISDTERVLLQAILGSDPKRELLSYVRLLQDIKPATLFFEKPDEKILPVCDLPDDDVHSPSPKLPLHSSSPLSRCDCF